MTLPLTLAQQQANTLENQFTQQMAQSFNQYRQKLNSVFNCRLMNNATNPPTPGTQVASADIVAALGTNAAAWFAGLAAHYTYLQAIYPAGLQSGDAIPAYTANEDGTVTLN